MFGKKVKELPEIIPDPIDKDFLRAISLNAANIIASAITQVSLRSEPINAADRMYELEIHVAEEQWMKLKKDTLIDGGKNNLRRLTKYEVELTKLYNAQLSRTYERYL